MKKLSTFFKKHGWCKNTLAKNKNGKSVHPTSQSASNFCIDGACIKLGLPTFGPDTFDSFVETKCGRNSAAWNDELCKSKAQLIAMCEKFEASLKK